MTSICGIPLTLFSFVASFFSNVFSSVFCRSGDSDYSSTVTVDLELGGVGHESKVITKSGSLDQRPVHILKVRKADSPPTAILLPNITPEKFELGRGLEDDSDPPALYNIPSVIEYTSFPSTESLSGDDRSSLDHSFESSATSSGGIALGLGSQDGVPQIDRQPTRNGFYENCSATHSTHFDSVEVAEDCVSEEVWEEHDEVFVDDDLAETVFEAECSSDESIYENDPDIPAHRWLKFAIEFVWLHKLPNTIQEMEDEEGAVSVDARGVKEVEELDVVDRDKVLTPVPEVIEHAPTPPLDAGQEPIVDTSLCRVKEVTEDLVDLLASLKVSFPESPSSICTTFTCNKSDNPHDTRTVSPSFDPIRNRLSREMDTEACQWLRPGTGGSEANVVHIPDDSSIVCTTGCRCSPHFSRPLSGRLSLSDMDVSH